MTFPDYPAATHERLPKNRACQGPGMHWNELGIFRRDRFLKRVACVFACFIPLACNSAPEPDVYPVRGEVFFNGKPAVGAAVVFHPVSADELSQAYATVQEDGSFELSTYGTYDGAEPGNYLVTITWREEEKVDGETVAQPDRLGERYANPKKSTLKATVTAGENVVPRYDLKE